MSLGPARSQIAATEALKSCDTGGDSPFAGQLVSWLLTNGRAATNVVEDRVAKQDEMGHVVHPVE
jgi:uncharacterized protein YijF (DUF1287 family)